MIHWSSRAGLAILLILGMIFMSGCTSPEVVNLDNVSALNNGSGGPHATITPTPTSGPTLTTAPSSIPTPNSGGSHKKPLIILATMNKTGYTVGDTANNVILTIIVDSDSPLIDYKLSLDGPAGNIINSTFIASATDLGNGQWEYDIPFYDPVLSTAGTYTYSRISVLNKDELWSDEWQAVTFQAKSPTPTPYVDKPVFSTVKMDKAVYGGNDTSAILTVVVNSQTPIVKKYLSLEGPGGHQLAGRYFTEQVSSIGNDQWTFQIAYPLSQMIGPGTYTWDQIVVVNANNVSSDVGPSASFQVSYG